MSDSLDSVLMALGRELPEILGGLTAGEVPVPWVRDHIYSRHFCRWEEEGTQAGYASGDATFVHALRHAAGDRQYWDPGWRVVSTDHEAGWSFVSNRGGVLVFVEERAALLPPEASPEAEVSLRLPCAREGLAPGFFYLYGPHGPLRRGPTVRLYLNLPPGAVPRLIGALMEELEEAGQRFEAKFANDPAAYGRVEPGVVSVEPEGYPLAARFLLKWRGANVGAQRSHTPLFTLPLGPGLAAAESMPDGEESFGQHRCRLLAEGVLEALVEGEQDPARWRPHVARAFGAAQLDLEHPYVQDLDPAALKL